MLSDTPAPEGSKVDEEAPKEKLLPALRASFDFCTRALDNLQDAKLGDTITYLGGRKTARARALIELAVDLSDHYSQMSVYLRLNGMLPPSAQPRK